MSTRTVAKFTSTSGPLRVAPVAALSLLAGCGGSGDVVQSTPPPPPSYTSLANATASTTLAAQAATYQTVGIANTNSVTTTVGASNVDISYDAATKTYTLRGTPLLGSSQMLEQSFGSGDVSPDDPGLYDKTKTVDGVTTYSRLRAAPSPFYTYVSYGTWDVGSTQGATTQFATAYFVYGVPTLSTDMPKTGSASYVLEPHGEGPLTVDGSGQLTANFGTSTVDVNLSLEYASSGQATPPNTHIATVTGSGTIGSTSGHPGFTSGLSGEGYTGSINGLFYGPQAAELGGAFSITNGQGGAVAGVVLGRKN